MLHAVRARQRHTGLLALLEEDSGRPTATDATLLEKFHAHQKHPHYVYSKQTAVTSFGVAHYAGTVCAAECCLGM